MIFNDQDQMYAEKFGLNIPNYKTIETFPDNLGIVQTSDMILSGIRSGGSYTMNNKNTKVIVANNNINFVHKKQTLKYRATFDNLFVCLFHLMDDSFPKEYETEEYDTVI